MMLAEAIGDSGAAVGYVIGAIFWGLLIGVGLAVLKSGKR